ncbi:MAG: HIT domain-containing protein [Patescibacteria group bacterium]
MGDSIFHKFVSGEVKPTTKVYFNDEDALAIDSNSPQAPVHILFIPKKEIVSIADMTEDDIETVGKLLYRAKLLADELGYGDGYRLSFNVREAGGQTVPYLHLHLLAGKKFSE